MVPEQVRLPAEVPPETSQPVLRSGDVRNRKPPDARTTNELSAVAWTSAPDADVEKSPKTKLPCLRFVEASAPIAVEPCPLAVVFWPIAVDPDPLAVVRIPIAVEPTAVA